MSPAARTTGTRVVAGLGALVAAGVCFTLVATTTGLPSFPGIDQMPLPGGADLGDHPYEITAEFGDVLSLAPQSSVKVNDVAVGRVTRISLTPGSWTAKVTMRVNGKIRMPPTPTPTSNSPASSARSTSSSRRPPRARPRARCPTVTGSRSSARTATPRSKRSSAPCPCSSTAVASPS